MSAVAKRIELPVEEARVQKADDVLIHVRFSPNAEVFTIDRLPEGVAPKAWFERLFLNAAPYYRTLSNGRGFFRIPAETFAAI
ncbi:hypothetical protein [Xanthobacter versatilis]|uniref:Uncharacterized protein n=1 Tax=Xanthobacter autotrophicus (strain ATCC BAA-1158 / Py2) TaxID=78245 RepID=A7IHQ5_XANP2|nr:conserved hypothetical protein [Xanthobacter autotrophicus Py2]